MSKSKFQKAVESSEYLVDAYCKGLEALEKAHQSLIEVSDASSLCGSIDLDSHLESSCPQDNRWDYGIGFRSTGRHEFVAWIEFHPVSMDEFDTFEKKFQWLIGWLKRNAIALHKMECEHVWIPTGKSEEPSLLTPLRKRIADKGWKLCSRYKID